MQAFVTALTGEGGISSTTLWQDVTYTVPFLVIIVGFAFGYHIIRKQLKSAGNRGKVNM